MDQYKMLKQNNRQSGQIIVVLLLIVVVVLAIGLSVVGRSNTEVLTAAKIENSARAFSAAEAGIEQSIATTLTGNTGAIPLPANSSNYNATGTVYPNPSVPNIEQKNIGGTPDADNTSAPFAFAQFWFANPSDSSYHASAINDNFNLYFGTAGSTRNNDPAVEVHIIYKTGSTLSDVRYYVDSAKGFRSNSLSIAGNTLPCDLTNVSIPTEFSSSEPFYCQVHLVASPAKFPWSTSTSSSYPILARVRILYSPNPQNVAIGPSSGTATLPGQIYVYSSTGTAGDSQRTVQVTRDTDVMPYLFDFALYSDNSVSK